MNDAARLHSNVEVMGRGNMEKRLWLLGLRAVVRAASPMMIGDCKQWGSFNGLNSEGKLVTGRDVVTTIQRSCTGLTFGNACQMLSNHLTSLLLSNC